MRIISLPFIFFAVGILIVSCESPKRGQEDQKDLKELQGTWQLISGVVDGKELPDEEVKNTQIIIKDNTFVLPNESGVGTSPKGTFIIYPNADPKQLIRPRQMVQILEKSHWVYMKLKATIKKPALVHPEDFDPPNLALHPVVGKSCRFGNV